MLNCKEVTEIISESIDSKIPFGKKLMLKLHLFMCSICKQYAIQIRLINRLAKAVFLMDKTLSSASLNRIKKHIREVEL